MTPTLNSFLHCSNLSSVREAGVLSDIISSYFVHMQMEVYILYVSVQAGAGTYLHKETENLHLKKM